MSESHCDYYDPHLTHDSPSVRDTLPWSGTQRGCERNGWTSRLRAWLTKPPHFSRNDASYSVLRSSPCRAASPSPHPVFHSSLPWDDASTPYRGPSHDAMMGPPPPGMMPAGPEPGMRLRMGGHMSMMPGSPKMRPPAIP